MNALHIATWNLDGYGVGAASRLLRQIETLRSLQADVLVLTEVRSTTQMPELKFWWSAEGCAPYSPRDRAVGIASPWGGRTLKVADSRLSVCVDLDLPAPLGRVIVYGTVIPYALDGVRQRAAIAWERHRKAACDVVADLIQLRSDATLKHASVVLAGDFNTCLDGSSWYGDPSAREMLVVGLERAGLRCHTLENIRVMRRSRRALVDHIWSSGNLRLEKPLHIWCDRDEPGRLSDHNGVAARLVVAE